MGISLTVFLDCHRSMNYDGTKELKSPRLNKFSIARAIAEVIATACAVTQTTLALNAFSANSHHRFACCSNHAESTTRRLAYVTPDSQAPLASYIKRCNYWLPGTAVVLISDFLGPVSSLNSLRGCIRHLAGRGHRVFGFQILHPFEATLPIDSPTSFADISGRSTRFVTDEDRGRYLSRMRHLFHNLRVTMRRTGGECSQFITDTPLATCLKSYARNPRALFYHKNRTQR
jgi:hypothetical protein